MSKLITLSFCVIKKKTKKHSRYEGTPAIKDLPEELVEILKVNISVNSSYTSKLIPVSLFCIQLWLKLPTTVIIKLLMVSVGYRQRDCTSITSVKT